MAHASVECLISTQKLVSLLLERLREFLLLDEPEQGRLDLTQPNLQQAFAELGWHDQITAELVHKIWGILLVQKPLTHQGP